MSCLLMLIVSTQVNAQTKRSLPRVMHQYLWQQDSWKLSHDVLTDYNASGKVISKVYRNVAGDSTSKDVFEFDAHNNVTFHGFYAKQSGNWTFIVGERFNLQYDQQNRIVFHTDERFNGTEWELNGRFTLTYHPSGKMETRTNEILFNGNWLPSVRIVILFDSVLQKPAQALFQVFRNGTWTNEERMLQFDGEFNETPDLTNYTMQQWLNGEWVNTEKQVTTYFNDSNVKIAEVMNWNDSAWVGKRKNIDERDEFDNIIFQEVNVFENGAYRFEDRNRHLLTYSNNNLVEDVIETYDPLKLKWHLSTKLVYDVFVAPTGLDHYFGKQPKITCFPNPVQSTLRVTIPEITVANEIEVWNVTGHCIQKVRVQSTETVVDLKDVPTGLYIIKVGEQQHRIIKQ